jgi:hypothetical protein
MKTLLPLLLLLSGSLFPLPAGRWDTPGPGGLRLYVFDTGHITAFDASVLSPGVDSGRTITPGNPSFLIVHPEGKLIWDTGLADSLTARPGGVREEFALMAHRRSLLGQLQALGVDPGSVDYLALSHMHTDHAGNANYFKNATMLIQQPEWAAASGPNPGKYLFAPQLYREVKKGACCTGTTTCSGTARWSSKVPPDTARDTRRCSCGCPGRVPFCCRVTSTTMPATGSIAACPSLPLTPRKAGLRWKSWSILCEGGRPGSGYSTTRLSPTAYGTHLMPTSNGMAAAGRVMVLVAARLLLGAAAGFAQAGHQALFWPAAAVQLGEGRKAFSGEVTLQSRFIHKPWRMQALAGTAHLRYQFPGTPLLLAAGYVAGCLPALGELRMVQVYGNYGWTGRRGRPFLRVAGDYLWYPEGKQRTVRLAPNGRVRVLVGLSPRLGKKETLLLTGEPFLRGQQAWLPETRAQAGLRRQLGTNLAVDLLYFNRWRRPVTAAGRHQWEHVCQLVVHYTVRSLSGETLARGFFDGR